MKVSVIAPTAIPARKANTIQVMKMTQAIASLGHQAQLIVPDGHAVDQGVDRSWDSLANHYGLQSQFPVMWMASNAASRKYDFAWRAVRWAKNWGADVIYTRLPQAAALSSLKGLATIFEIHDRPQGTMAPMLLRLFLRGSGAQRLIVISEALADYMNKEYQYTEFPTLMRVLPDGVDLQRYTGLPSPEESREQLSVNLQSLNQIMETQFSAELFTVGYTGHLYPGRGVSLLLEMAARLPEINFLVVGGEPGDVSRVAEHVVEHKLNNLTLTGFVPNIDLPLYQAACDVLLMPYQPRVSASSGGDIGRYLSPMKLFEYLACGRVICSSNLPVLQEILSPENAILLPPEDSGAWVTAIQELKDDPALRSKLSRSARAAAKEYSWENRAEKMLDGIQLAGK